MNAKPRKCANKACRKKFTPSANWLTCCGTDCMLAVIRERKAKQVRREQRKERERLKSLGTVCAESQASVNLYVRVRDFGKGCISCETGKVEDAGHYFPIGSKYRVNRLRFDTRAIHGQCRACNSYKGGGNIHGYTAGLIRRYGEEFLLELDALKRDADQGLLAPLTKDEARQIAADHRKMARELGRKSNMAACA